MQKANLEFRKIPSLKFLYEVNANGTIFRNARSKRCLKCVKRSYKGNMEYWITVVKIGGKTHTIFLHSVVAECWLGKKPKGYEIDHIDKNSLNNHYTNLCYVTHTENMENCVYRWSVPVRLIRNEETIDFELAKQAAEYLATIYPNKTIKSFKVKFNKRRHHIFDYDVIYLNAETGHGDQEMGKEQST